jgi:poly(3-hydroxybutyrate) depolymerase
LGNIPVGSDGCGQDNSDLATGSHTIAIGTTTRTFVTDVPTTYDKSKPYRVFFVFHGMGATGATLANDDQNYAFYGLKRNAIQDPAIFVAPTVSSGAWQASDITFIDALISLVKSKLCVDVTRTFAVGFSLGGTMVYALSLNHQKQLRAVVGMSAGTFNFGFPNDLFEHIGYMGVSGVSDGTIPLSAGKACALTHATDNTCTLPAEVPTVAAGSMQHQCYDYAGCATGYPVKMCSFDGGHITAPYDGGTGSDYSYANTWVPAEIWRFITQF